MFDHGVDQAPEPTRSRLAPRRAHRTLIFGRDEKKERRREIEN